jgi:hypothetical protein
MRIIAGLNVLEGIKRLFENDFKQEEMNRCTI